jgi:peptidoglycan/LPS O-acetylase OafA/YrhL
MSRQFPALRGIAILLVVVNHAITLSMETANELGMLTRGPFTIALDSVRTIGLAAVPIFLFLSGAYLAYAARGRPMADAYRKVLPSLRFILVPYVIWSLVFYVLIYLLRGDAYTLLGYVRNLIVGYPYNFVPILVFFYMIGPPLVSAAERWPVALLICVLAYQMVTVAILNPGFADLVLPEWMFYLTIPGLRLSVALWGIFFPLGVVQGVHQESVAMAMFRARWLLVFAIAACYVGLIAGLVVGTDVPMLQILFPLTAVLLLPTLHREDIPGARSLERLGRLAYGLYLTNLTVISLGLALLAWGMSAIFGALVIVILLLIALTIGANALLFQVFSLSPAPSARRYLFG